MKKKKTLRGNVIAVTGEKKALSGFARDQRNWGGGVTDQPTREAVNAGRPNSVPPMVDYFQRPITS